MRKYLHIAFLLGALFIGLTARAATPQMVSNRTCDLVAKQLGVTDAGNQLTIDFASYTVDAVKNELLSLIDVIIVAQRPGYILSYIDPQGNTVTKTETYDTLEEAEQRLAEMLSKINASKVVSASVQAISTDITGMVVSGTNGWHVTKSGAQFVNSHSNNAAVTIPNVSITLPKKTGYSYSVSMELTINDYSTLYFGGSVVTTKRYYQYGNYTYTLGDSNFYWKTQPSNAVIIKNTVTKQCMNLPITLTGEAYSNDPITYQWYKVNNAIPTKLEGETKPYLTLTSSDVKGIYQLLATSKGLTISSKQAEVRLITGDFNKVCNDVQTDLNSNSTIKIKATFLADANTSGFPDAATVTIASLDGTTEIAKYGIKATSTGAYLQWELVPIKLSNQIWKSGIIYGDHSVDFVFKTSLTGFYTISYCDIYGFSDSTVAKLTTEVFIDGNSLGTICTAPIVSNVEADLLQNNIVISATIKDLANSTSEKLAAVSIVSKDINMQYTGSTLENAKTGDSTYSFTIPIPSSGLTSESFTLTASNCANTTVPITIKQTDAQLFIKTVGCGDIYATVNGISTKIVSERLNATPGDIVELKAVSTSRFIAWSGIETATSDPLVTFTVPEGATTVVGTFDCNNGYSRVLQLVCPDLSANMALTIDNESELHPEGLPNESFPSVERGSNQNIIFKVSAWNLLPRYSTLLIMADDGTGYTECARIEALNIDSNNIGTSVLPYTWTAAWSPAKDKNFGMYKFKAILLNQGGIQKGQVESNEVSARIYSDIPQALELKTDSVVGATVPFLVDITGFDQSCDLGMIDKNKAFQLIVQSVDGTKTYINVDNTFVQGSNFKGQVSLKLDIPGYYTLSGIAFDTTGKSKLEESTRIERSTAFPNSKKILVLPQSISIYEGQTWRIEYSLGQTVTSSNGKTKIDLDLPFINITPDKNTWTHFGPLGVFQQSTPCVFGSTIGTKSYSDGTPNPSNVTPVTLGTRQYTSEQLRFYSEYTNFSVLLDIQEVPDDFTLNTSEATPLRLHIPAAGKTILPILKLAENYSDGMRNTTYQTPTIGADNLMGNESDLRIMNLSVISYSSTNLTKSDMDSLFTITDENGNSGDTAILFNSPKTKYGTILLSYTVANRNYPSLSKHTGYVEVYDTVAEMLDPMTGGAEVRSKSIAPTSFILPSRGTTIDSSNLFEQSINSIFMDGTKISGTHAYYVLRTTACYFIQGTEATQWISPLCDSDGIAANINDCLLTVTKQLGGGTTTSILGTTATNDILLRGIEDQCYLEKSCNYYTLVPKHVECTSVVNSTDFYTLVGKKVNILENSPLTCIKLPCPNRKLTECK